jgi:hypothetical protein
MVTLKGHKRCDYQDPENPELRCYRQPSFNFFGSVGGIFCHQHKVQLHHRGTQHRLIFLLYLCRFQVWSML